MKEVYVPVKIDILSFTNEDIITSSAAVNTTPMTSLGGENEGPAGDAFL